MTTTISLDSLRELAAFRAERGCAISLYVDLDPSLSPTVPDVHTRISALLDEAAKQGRRRQLDRDEREGLRADLERLERYFDLEFDRDGASGFAVFVDGPDRAWTTLPLAEPGQDVVRVAYEFYLAPLVPLLGRGDGVLVAVVNRERGSVYGLRDGRLVELADLTEDAPRRHDQGGWAQARLQRHVDNVSHEHYKTVADELERHFRRLGRPRIVVVATEDARSEIADVLPTEVAAAVIGWSSAQAHATPVELADVVGPVIERWRADREAEHLERWREGVGRAGRASSGWQETLEAASDARVELLFYRSGAEHSAVRCPRCGRAQVEGDVCPLDGTPFEQREDGLNLAVRQTLAHGGGLWAVRTRQDLEPVGGIGALLRF